MQGPGFGGASRPAQPGGGKHPCEAFVGLRSDAEKGAQAIQAAGKRKATREQVCPLFKQFAAAEGKMLKFMEANQKLCGVPPTAVKQIKGNYDRTIQMRDQICAAGGPGPARPAGPSLSDALGAPLVAEPPKRGRSTFDTLSGNVLNR